MLGVGVDLLGRPELDDPAQVHDRDPVAEELRGREVVGDVDVGEVELRLELDHQLQDLRPHAHVEHRDRLVGDQDVRAEDDRPGEHRALLLAAGEVGRVLVGELRRRREPDALERLGDQLLALGLAGGDPVEAQRVADRGADRHRRVERGVRVLEDDLQPPAKRAHLGLAEPGDLLAAELDAALRRLDQPEQGPPQRRLARPRFADQPEDLAVAQIEVDPVDGGNRSGLPAPEPIDERAADRVVRLQIADLDQRLRVAVRRIAGSSVESPASIMPPPPRRSRRARASPCRPPGSRPRGRAASRRRAGRRSAMTSGGCFCMHTDIASGHRGWKRQPGGGSIRFGGAPGM